MGDDIRPKSLTESSLVGVSGPKRLCTVKKFKECRQYIWVPFSGTIYAAYLRVIDIRINKKHTLIFRSDLPSNGLTLSSSSKNLI